MEIKDYSEMSRNELAQEYLRLTFAYKEAVEAKDAEAINHLNSKIEMVVKEYLNKSPVRPHVKLFARTDGGNEFTANYYRPDHWTKYNGV